MNPPRSAAPKLNGLKGALQGWEKAQKAASAVEPAPPSSPPAPVVRHIYSPRVREIVVGGDIKWKPVDRTAALLIAKAPWWAKPPPPDKSAEPVPVPVEKPAKSKAIMSATTPEKKSILAHHNIPGSPTADITITKSDEQMSFEVRDKFIKETGKAMTATENFTERAVEARAAMDILENQWKTSWLEFQTSTGERLLELRQYRLATETEMRLLMASLREVRAFFLDKSYETEIARLREFVDLCERLQKLKESGFLDQVADTMLKLA